jgi:RND family efflux transporter MFP subunit
MKRRHLLGAATAACFLTVAACGPRGSGTVRAEAEKILTVSVARVERHNLSRELDVAAEFRPYQEVEVHAKVAGYLKSIAVDVGDRVAAGQVLAVLEVPEYAEELAHAAATERRTELDVIRARSEVKRAESAYTMRKLSFERLESVSKTRPKLVAQQEVDTTAGQFREAEGQWESAKAALAATEQQVRVSSATKDRVRTMMNYLRITAPFSGVVTKRYAHPGAMIQAGTASQTQAMPVVRISQIDHLRMVLPIPESAVNRVRLGGAVEVRVDALKQVIQGRVARFSGRLDASTRTMETEVDIDNRAGSVLPGMFGTASIVLETRQDALAAPVQAVSGHNTAPTVFLLNTGRTLEERAVTLGMETPNLLEITSGLAEGDLVVIGNRGGLKPGKKANAKLMPGGGR